MTHEDNKNYDETDPSMPKVRARPVGSRNRVLPPITDELRAEAEAEAEKPAEPYVREEDPRERAARRAAEVRAHGGNTEEGVDKYFIDPSLIPPGWSYEWKRKLLLGKEDPAYDVNLTRGGWEPVPARRHPEMMPKGKYSTIERDGMILMERPYVLTENARSIEKKRARQQVKFKEDQLNNPPAGTFERTNKDQPLANIKKSYEAMEIPEK